MNHDREGTAMSGPVGSSSLVRGTGFGPATGSVLLPDAIRGWALVLLDAARGRPDDYFLLQVMTRGAAPGAPPGPGAAETAALAQTLAGRLSAWYAA
jgi:hypothetical protein